MRCTYVVYGNGHYRRGRDGVWVYTLTGEPVPDAQDKRLPDGRIVLDAPELHPSTLLSIEEAAELYGVQPRSFRVMKTRGFAPAEVFRFGGSPVWTRPVLEGSLRKRRSRR